MDNESRSPNDLVGSRENLPMNLQGIISLIDSARDNLESANFTIDLVEEFFRTIGAISYSRVQSNQISSDTRTKIDDFIVRKMKTPSFGTWTEFSDRCIKPLKQMGDRFATDNKLMMDNKIKDWKVAKRILTEIYRLDSGTSPHKNRIKIKRFLSETVNLRNIIRHRTLSNTSLQPLLDMGFKDYVVSMITELFARFHLRLYYPISIEEEGVMSYVVFGTKRRYQPVVVEKKENISLGECYLQIYDDEYPFQFRTRIIEYDWKLNQCYVYLKSEGVQVHCIPLQGNPHSRKGKWSSLEEVFEIRKLKTHIVNDVVTDSEYVFDAIRQHLDPNLAIALEQMELESSEKLVVANAILKEYSLKYSQDWDWKKWYSGLIIGFVKLGEL